MAMGRSRSYDVTKPTQDTNSRGIGWVFACCFLAGDLAGAGMMALPVAMVQGGVIFGTISSVICCICSAYSAAILGDNLMIMRRRWPEYRDHNGKPYIEMARRSLGGAGERTLKVMVYLTAMGTVIVYLLLAANNIATFLNGNFGIHVHKCVTLLAVSLVLWPLVLPRSPMQFTWIALFSLASSILTVVVILWGSTHDMPHCAPQADYTSPYTVDSVALAFGTIMFSYGGHVAFPTIQMDMKRPGLWTRTVYLSYAFIFVVMYTPVSMFGYYVYGNSMTDTIITSLQVNWMQQTVSVCMIIHALTICVIVFSPLAQGVETWFDTREAFSLARFLIRTALLAFAVFVALTFPRFGVILDLVGGSFITAMALIWPGLFHLLLTAGEKKRAEKLEKEQLPSDSEDEEMAGAIDVFKHNDPLTICSVAVLMTIGVFGGLAATATAFQALLGAHMETPCYVQWLSSGFEVQNVSGSVHCCGVGRNISVWPHVDTAAYCARN